MITDRINSDAMFYLKIYIGGKVLEIPGSYIGLIEAKGITRILRKDFTLSSCYEVDGILIEINLLVNYVLFADISPNIIMNIELMLFNGAMYGLRIFDYYNMPLLLYICLVVYTSWILFCGYHLINNRKGHTK